MSERSRKKARQDARRSKPVDLDKIAPAPTPSQRSKFRVARVQREVHDAIMSASPRRVTPERRQSDWGLRALERMEQLVQTQMPQVPSQPARASVEPVRNRPAQPGMAEKPNLKCRPKDNTPKGGKGSGRNFVPWDKNC